MSTAWWLTAIGMTLLFAGIGWMLWEMHKAPEGWEDEYGFHYGKQSVPREWTDDWKDGRL